MAEIVVLFAQRTRRPSALVILPLSLEIRTAFMFVKVLIVLMLLAIVYTLVSSFWFLVKDKGEGTRTVRRLSWRIGLSLLLFAFLYVAFLAGWIQPGSGNPIRVPAETSAPEPSD